MASQGKLSGRVSLQYESQGCAVQTLPDLVRPAAAVPLELALAESFGTGAAEQVLEELSTAASQMDTLIVGWR
jgi:hypothetical protein